MGFKLLFWLRLTALVCLVLAVAAHARADYGGRGGWWDDDHDHDDDDWRGGRGRWGDDDDDDDDGDGAGGGSNGRGGDDDDDDDFPGGLGGLTSINMGAILNYRRIHGILCALSMVVLFPMGSVLMRLLPGRVALWVHGLWQIVATCVYIAGVGLGIYLVQVIQTPRGSLLDSASTNYHPIIGIVVLLLLFVQPFLGYIHHRKFKRLQRRQAWSYLHIYNGRITITLAMVNGGLGLHLADASEGRKRTYIIVSAIIWALWMAVALFSEIRRMRYNRRVEAEARDRDGSGSRDHGARDVPPPVARGEKPEVYAKGERTSED